MRLMLSLRRRDSFNPDTSMIHMEPPVLAGGSFFLGGVVGVGVGGVCGWGGLFGVVGFGMNLDLRDADKLIVRNLILGHCQLDDLNKQDRKSVV